jgi:hypothetical protein
MHQSLLSGELVMGYFDHGVTRQQSGNCDPLAVFWER